LIFNAAILIYFQDKYGTLRMNPFGAEYTYRSYFSPVDYFLAIHH